MYKLFSTPLHDAPDTSVASGKRKRAILELSTHNESQQKTKRIRTGKERDDEQHEAYSNRIERMEKVHEEDKEDETMRPLISDTYCVICMGLIDITSGQLALATESCAHDANVCSHCLQQWIQTKVAQGSFSKIGCPSCGDTLQYADIYNHATEEVFERLLSFDYSSSEPNVLTNPRYDNLLTRGALNAMPTYRDCLNPKCDAGQDHPAGEAEPIFTCKACGHKACVVHNVDWHTDETCEQYTDRRARERRAEDEANVRATTAYIRHNAKICPNNDCHYRIEKNGGCDHMTCKLPSAPLPATVLSPLADNLLSGLSCRHEFCWECLKPYDKISRLGNHHHKKATKTQPACSYWRAYRPPVDPISE